MKFQHSISLFYSLKEDLSRAVLQNEAQVIAAVINIISFCGICHPVLAGFVATGLSLYKLRENTFLLQASLDDEYDNSFTC